MGFILILYCDLGICGCYDGYIDDDCGISNVRVINFINIKLEYHAIKDGESTITLAANSSAFFRPVNLCKKSCSTQK